MFCTSCGASMPDSSRFCTSCGTVLKGPGAGKPAPAPKPAPTPAPKIADAPKTATTLPNGEPLLKRTLRINMAKSPSASDLDTPIIEKKPKSEKATAKTESVGAEYEYRVLTREDKCFGGKFSPALLQKAFNVFAEHGWRVISCSLADLSLETSKGNEFTAVLERKITK